MTSPRKVNANRRNALLSTGPKTTAGRLRSRRNALGSGLYAQTLLLPNEDVRTYARLRRSVYAAYPPDGAIEEGLVELIIGDLWRLNRFILVENEFLERTREARTLASRSYEPDGSLRTFLDGLSADSPKRSNGDDQGANTNETNKEGTGSVHNSARLSETLRRNLSGPGRILLEAFVPPVSQSPMEDICRQRGRTLRQFLRNLAALEALCERRGCLSAEALRV